MPEKLEVATPHIRNVLLLGHGATGKTTLAEELLRAAGITDGSAGGTGRGGGMLDFDPEERERGCSLGLAMAAVPWDGHKINLLDAPGGAEAIGDAFGALRSADVAVFVVDATAGVQPQHEQLWEACDELALPRVVFLNMIDRDGAAFQRTVDELRERYGERLAPVHMPIGTGPDFTGVIDLLHFTAVELVDGQVVEREVSDKHRTQATRNRVFLVEAIVENDDELLVRYLEGDTPDAKELGGVFAGGIARAGFFPLLCGSATLGVGVRMLADFIVEECPSPADLAATRGEDVSGQATAAVAKTFSDPYVGRINILRVLHGGLDSSTTLTNARTGATHRFHQLFTLQGKQQLPVEGAAAGDVVAVAKLDDVLTGDLLHAPDAPVPPLPAIPVPEPYYRVALEPASAGDEDKLSTALHRIVEEDPSLRVERDPVTKQLVLRAYGPSHVDIAVKRLERKFNVAVTQRPPRIAYRETIRSRATGVGKHVKQTGGHGQYGITHIEVEPLARGQGFVFEDKIVGGVIPTTFIPSVEKGITEAMNRGVRAGYPVVDIAVRLYDGKHHSVDSSDMAFQTAGSLAFKDAARRAQVVLLEPMLEVDVSVPDHLTGDVMGDLSARRGRIQGTDRAGRGRQMIHALVPEAEMLAYPAELRALTSGYGTVAMRYHHHQEVPDHIAREIEARAAADTNHTT